MKFDFILISNLCVDFSVEYASITKIWTLNQKKKTFRVISVILKVNFARLIHYATLDLGLFMCIYINLLLNFDVLL